MGFYISTTMEIAIKNTLHATQMKNGQLIMENIIIDLTNMMLYEAKLEMTLKMIMNMQELFDISNITHK